MDTTPEQIAASMTRPGVEVHETHISWVFLTGDRAVKLRKAVVLPFLDYGTAERRRQMCDEELRLGRRLAPDVYLGLRSVVRRGDGFALADPDAAGACEHVVEMRRFDEADTLAARLESGDAGEQDVRAVARLVAEFHARAEPAPPGAFGAPEIAATVSENFTTLLAFADEIGDPRLAPAHRFAVAFVHGNHTRLTARRAHVRDCHGDLRAEHVLLEGGRVEIFDPVEFDPALRHIDVAADLAFLVMDLTEAGREELATVLVEEYRRAGGDCGSDALLGFFAAYRAWVRAKVACLRAAELPADRAVAEFERARSLAELGERFSWRARRPIVLVVCGAAATGKTVLAQTLAAASGLPHVSSDIVRKQLAGLDPRERAPLAAYSVEATLRTYAELGARAAAAVLSGGAIVDATFHDRAHRDSFRGGFEKTGPEPIFVECLAPASVVAERASLREHGPAHTSDATAEVALRQLEEFDPFDEVDPDLHFPVRTDRGLRAIVDDVEAALDARLARGR